jgi:hypothetical protein
MMRNLIFNLCFIVLGIPAYSQVTKKYTPYDDKIIFDANKMMNSYKLKDYDNFIDGIYPMIVSTAGGKEKMRTELEKALNIMSEQGISIDSVIFSKPNPIIRTKEELQTTLVETLIMTIPQGKMINKSTLICISADNGETWFFIDSSNNDVKTLQSQFPNLSDSLIIGKMGKPIVFKK